MKKKKFLIILIVLFFIICFVPVVSHWKDGGTVTYSAFLYKVIDWNSLDGKQGVEVYLFPKNFHSLDYYYHSEEKMFFKKDFGNLEEYESMKTDDFSTNENYWRKYNGISNQLAQEIPTDKLYEIASNYVSWIVGESFDDEMHQKLQSVPEILRFAYLVYNFECEINNGGFDQFYFNSIGYEVFEIQKGLEFFGLTENKKILDKSIDLLKQKIDIKKYFELSANRDLPTEDFEDEFADLDEQFYEYPEDIEQTINSYLDKHRDDLVTVK